MDNTTLTEEILPSHSFPSPERVSEIDRCIIVLDKSPAFLEIMKSSFQSVGIPLEDNSSHSIKYEIINAHAGRTSFQLLSLLDNKTLQEPEELPQELLKWASEGKKGITAIYLRTKCLDEVYLKLKNKGIPLSEPSRGYYQKDKEKKSNPWRTLDLPPLESIPLLIRWIQYDPMIWNLIHSGLKPNSKDLSGIEGLDSLRIMGTLSDNDKKLLEQIFENIWKHNGNISLKKGEISFTKAPKTHFAFKAAAKKEEFKNKSLNISNFSIDVS